MFKLHNGKVTEMECCLGEAAAFACFSNRLKSMPSQEFRISRFIGVNASTDVNDDEQDFNHLYLSRFSEIFLSESLVKKMEWLANVAELENSLLSYFGSALPQKEKLQKRAERRSETQNHLLLGNWLVYAEPGGYGNDEFVMEKYDNSLNRQVKRLSGSQYKCSFVFDDNTDVFWLSTDWDDSADFKLDGLNITQLRQIERQFFAKGNWNRLLNEQIVE
ncbi:hypothetical protein [Rheinheimera soli]|uniref:Uncharacterized protein n=1 Tax=Rheinheimera soli TaxID=443616 RepID=A0ABU1W5E0_9GAMM|nr:hypothetical protein [Rheinheimera soli]MDR7123185.1 hypothetical protein [Rheinheimera soli]